MKTNFEHWKENLKPEDLVFKETDPLGDPRTYWAVWNISGSACESCPARQKCHDLHEQGLSKCCGYAFKTWAKAEHKEKE